MGPRRRRKLASQNNDAGYREIGPNGSTLTLGWHDETLSTLPLARLVRQVHDFGNVDFKGRRGASGDSPLSSWVFRCGSSHGLVGIRARSVAPIVISSPKAGGRVFFQRLSGGPIGE